nr:MAG TPA: putative zinc-ribbon domain protein [Caudoviricetes sp.]
MNKKEFEDKTLKCKDCGNDFIWKAGEQRFYAEKELQAPIRCKECRNKRKQKFEERTTEEKNKEFEKILESWKKNTVNL